MLLFDITCIWMSLLFAMSLRYSSTDWINRYDAIASISLFLAAPLTALPFFIRMGLYRAVLRYINSVAFITILRACAFSSITFIVVDALFLTYVALPRSVPFIYFTTLSMLMLGSRYFIQRWLMGETISSSIHGLVNMHYSGFRKRGVKALVYGSNREVSDLLKVLDGMSEYQPVVVISTDDLAYGGEICGRTVYSPKTIDKAIDRYEPQVILLAMPMISHLERLAIINSVQSFRLPIKTVPTLQEVVAGKSKLQDMREINILDVLWREEVSPSDQLLAANIYRKTVMVTGAGGSIGSEIVRQVLRQNPQRLLLVDHSEYNLYVIESEVRQWIASQQQSIDVIAFLESVTDQNAILQVLTEYPTQTIYHAAGYKHVPMVEANIRAGVYNNTLGTVFTAQAAIATCVDNFVLISTDKAVRPANVMGASKRLAEMALQAMSRVRSFKPFTEGNSAPSMPKILKVKTNLSMVRFGNVLGSSGSVIPLFRQQIASGGPITVTHEEVIRYFMSIPEAAQLVIQAGAMAVGGDVFVLDMGQPIRIAELAKRMVELSGLTIRDSLNPEGDIAITYTGLRAGEKLYEELLIGDSPENTQHAKIFKANEPAEDWLTVTRGMEAILKGFEAQDLAAVYSQLSGLVAGFTPDRLSEDNLLGKACFPEEAQSVA